MFYRNSWSVHRRVLDLERHWHLNISALIECGQCTTVKCTQGSMDIGTQSWTEGDGLGRHFFVRFTARHSVTPSVLCPKHRYRDRFIFFVHLGPNTTHIWFEWPESPKEKQSRLSLLEGNSAVLLPIGPWELLLTPFICVYALYLRLD